MKKALSLLLALVLCFALCACGNQESENQENAFALSKQSFTNIHSAYEIIQAMSADIYEAWRIGTHTGTSSLVELDDLSFLTNNITLTDNDIYRGLAYIQFLYDDFVEYAGIYSYVDVDSIDDYIKFLKDCDQFDFSSRDDPNDYCYKPDPIYDFISRFGFSGYVYLVVNAYEANGTGKQITTLLNSARAQMKTMSDEHSDYEHYPALKGYYTTTQAFFDYCKKPTGSFEQAVTTIETYRNEARNHYYSLEFMFNE